MVKGVFLWIKTFRSPGKGLGYWVKAIRNQVKPVRSPVKAIVGPVKAIVSMVKPVRGGFKTDLEGMERSE
jgi:hypothetical protein